MATFLELVKEVGEESGTVDLAALPASVTGQTGRLLRLVNWTRRAWTDIQSRRSDWLWLEEDFSGQTSDGTRYYRSNDTRFRDWIYNIQNVPRPSFTIYDSAIGQDDETGITFWKWSDFRGEVLTGSRATERGKPRIISVDPARQLALYPIPDGAYTLRGVYRKGPQVLSADADEPEVASVHHPVIKWRALMYLAQFDEAVEAQFPLFEREFRTYYEDLLHAETPRVEAGGSLDEY